MSFMIEPCCVSRPILYPLYFLVTFAPLPLLQHGILATDEGYIVIEPSELPWQPPLTDDGEDRGQAHLVYYHIPSIHSEKACSAIHARGGKFILQLNMRNHLQLIQSKWVIGTTTYTMMLIYSTFTRVSLIGSAPKKKKTQFGG